MPPKYRRGDYPIPIAIKKRKAAPTRDANGKVDWNDAANYDDYHSTFARFGNQGGREFQSAKQAQQEISAVLITRSSSKTRDLDGTYRIVFRGRTLEVIESFDLAESLDEVQILCKESK